MSQHHPTNFPRQLARQVLRPLLYAGSHTRHQQPTMVKLKQLTAGDGNTAAKCPGWVEPKKTVHLQPISQGRQPHITEVFDRDQ